MSDSEQSYISQDAASESSAGSPVPLAVSSSRPVRRKLLPAKLRELREETYKELQFEPEKTLSVKCSQTGKLHTVKLKEVSREDGEPFSERDFRKGSHLMLDLKVKSYPVQFVEFKDKESVKRKSGSKAYRKRPLEKQQVPIQERRNVPEVLELAKMQSAPKRPAIEQGVTALDNKDKDLLVDLARNLEKMMGRIEKLEKMMAKIMEMMRATPTPKEGPIEIAKQDDSADHMVNGINVMRIPSRDAYSYGLQLLDMLFSKEELASSLLFKSKKSEKPGLDRDRVDQLFKLMDKRYNEWDLKVFTSKANQKCRDSKV